MELGRFFSIASSIDAGLSRLIQNSFDAFAGRYAAIRTVGYLSHFPLATFPCAYRVHLSSFRSI